MAYRILFTSPMVAENRDKDAHRWLRIIRVGSQTMEAAGTGTGTGVVVGVASKFATYNPRTMRFMY